MIKSLSYSQLSSLKKSLKLAQDIVSNGMSQLKALNIDSTDSYDMAVMDQVYNPSLYYSFQKLEKKCFIESYFTSWNEPYYSVMCYNFEPSKQLLKDLSCEKISNTRYGSFDLIDDAIKVFDRFIWSMMDIPVYEVGLF